MISWIVGVLAGDGVSIVTMPGNHRAGEDAGGPRKAQHFGRVKRGFTRLSLVQACRLEAGGPVRRNPRKSLRAAQACARNRAAGA